MENISLDATKPTALNFQYLPEDVLSIQMKGRDNLLRIPSEETTYKLEIGEQFTLPENTQFAVKLKSTWIGGIVLKPTLITGPLIFSYTPVKTEFIFRFFGYTTSPVPFFLSILIYILSFWASLKIFQSAESLTLCLTWILSLVLIIPLEQRIEKFLQNKNILSIDTSQETISLIYQLYGKTFYKKQKTTT